MAGRVNTKFVVALVGAAVLVLGAGLFLFWQMMNQTGEDHAAMARQLEIEGDWRGAEEAWGRAVGHERTNLDWLESWQKAISMVGPRTDTEYQNFFAEYVQIARQRAVTARDNPEITTEYLEIRTAFMRRMGSSDRRGVEGLSTEIDSLLAWYPEGGALQNERDRLRRYRGIAWATLAGRTSTLTDEEIEKAKDDLEAALSADPTDGESARSLVLLIDTQMRRAQRATQTARAEAFKAEAQGVLDALLEADPQNEWGRVARLELLVDEMEGMTVAQRSARQAELREHYMELMDSLVSEAATADPIVLSRAYLLELVLDPESRGARSIQAFEKAAEARNQRTDLVLQLARMYNAAGRFEDAVAKLQVVEAQEKLPVSIEGVFRETLRRQAPMLLAEFAVAQIGEVDDAAEQDRLLGVAIEARERFAAAEGEENARVSMLDGQIAVARADLAQSRNDARAADEAYNRALGHFARYNELTQYTDSNGLWREGRVATRLAKTGLARDRFNQMMQMNPNDPNVLLALADVEEQLATQSSLEAAYGFTARALELAPMSEAIQRRLSDLAKRTFRTQSEDPIEKVLFESERLLQGVDERAPDSIAAEKVLRDALAENPGDSRLARQLVRVLMASDRLAEARTFIAEMKAQYPDDATIETLSRRLEADSLVDIIVLGIEESAGSELNKLLEKVEIFRRFGETERAREALAQAVAIAPDDPDVVEQNFLSLLADDRIEEARTEAARAAQLNADRLDGITFQARLLANESRHLEAIELLREATSRRPTDAPLWRLLASQQVELGRINEALDSYRRALSITEADTTTIRGYVATLASVGRRAEALNEARRLKEFGERDPVFLDVYLRLEAEEGGAEGLETAINRRRQIMGERPFDTQNKIELANLYIEARQWEPARQLLDSIRAESKPSLAWVQTLARWFADQGRVRTQNGFEDGIDLARGAFVDYILSGDGSASDVDAYLAMARFMMERGRDDVALRAIEEARPLQDPTQLRAEKLYGELMMMRSLPRAASEAFTKVVEAGADDARQNYRKLLIEMLLRVNEYDLASAQIDALAAENATDLTVLMQRADIAMYRGDTEEALRLVDRAIEAHPSQSLPFIKRAQFLMPNQSLWRDAQRNLEEALRLSPNDPQAHKLMATMHFRQGRKNEAIQSLRQSLAANPGQDAVLIGLLIELIDDNRAGEALDVANEVIDRRASDATLMLNASRVFSQRGEHDRANVLLQRAWRLTKDVRVGLAYIQNLLESDPPRPQPAAEVIAELERLGAEVNEDPIILATRANIEQKDGKSQRASSFLTRAYERSLENPGLIMQWFREVRRTFGDEEAAPQAIAFMTQFRQTLPAGTEQRDWLSYGLALLRIQDETQIAEAESDLTALQQDSSSELIKRLSHRLLGSGRFGRGEFEAAAQAWQAGIEAFPDDWEMHNNLAYCIGVELERPADAVPLARQAAQLADSRADVYDTLGKLLLLQGEFDQAEDALLSARERQRTERERATILLNFARLALARGNREEAIRHWTEADTAVYTLPSLREVIGDDLEEVKAQIDSAPAQD